MSAKTKADEWTLRPEQPAGRERRRKVVWAAIAVLGLAAAALLLQQPREPDYSKVHVGSFADLERELGALRERLGIPGLSAAIAQGDQVVWSRGFGWANLDRHTTVDADTTSFHLASVTKPYTSTVVLQLAEERKLNINAAVAEFGLVMPRDEPVRVWHLLSHTSDRTPGTKYRYDPAAFGALTTVVERASGRPFSVELADRIIRRLNLKYTAPNPRDVDPAACRRQLILRFMNLCSGEVDAEHTRQAFAASGLDRQAIDARLAQGYVREWGASFWPGGLFGSMRPEQHLTDLFASSGLVASATDVARFSIALDQGKLLRPETLQRMFEPAIESNERPPAFGLGWFLQRHEGALLAWQFGQAFESSSLLLKIPARRLTFVALANSDGLSRQRWLGNRGDVLASPAATLFLNWYKGAH